MMRYQYLPFVLMAILFTACSSEEEFSSRSSNIPVEFGTYVGRTTSATRAGTIGAMDLAKLKETGFGVFCQHQDNSDFEYSKIFDFLFNQKVEYSGGNWTYSPVKYWPNETADKLSFFAYAPYIPSADIEIERDASTESNYLYMSANGMRSDNTYILYQTSDDPANSVDLLYATLMNQTKLDIDTRVLFQFHHALARFGLSVQGVFDDVPPGSDEKDAQTKIVIDQIKLIRPSLAYKGKFHLCPQPYVENPLDHPYWEWDAPYFAKKDFEVKNSSIRGSLRYREFDTEFSDAESDTYFSETLPDGVSNTETPVCYSSEQEQYFMLIPNEEIAVASISPLVVNIVYYVITRDAKLTRNKPQGLSIVKNNITAQLPASFQFEHGKSYKLKLRLGMTSAKFTVSQANWDFEEPTIPENEHIILQPLVVEWKLADEEHVELLENIVFYPAGIDSWVKGIEERGIIYK